MPNPIILAFTNLANLLKGSFAFALCTQVQCKTLLYDIMPPPLSDSAVIDNVGSKELDLETNNLSSLFDHVILNTGVGLGEGANGHHICAGGLNLARLAT